MPRTSLSLLLTARLPVIKEVPARRSGSPAWFMACVTLASCSPSVGLVGQQGRARRALSRWHWKALAQSVTAPWRGHRPDAHGLDTAFQLSRPLPLCAGAGPLQPQAGDKPCQLLGLGEPVFPREGSLCPPRTAWPRGTPQQEVKPTRGIQSWVFINLRRRCGVLGALWGPRPSGESGVREGWGGPQQQALVPRWPSMRGEGVCS